MHLKDPAAAARRPLAGPRLRRARGDRRAALAKSADERFATATEFAAALDAVVPRRGVVTPVAGVPVVEPRPPAEHDSARTVSLAVEAADGSAPASPPPSAATPPAPTRAASTPAPARPAPDAPRALRRRLAIAAAAALAVVVVAVAAFTGGDPASAPEAATDAPPPPPPDRPDPADEALARANDLVAGGQKSAALDLVLAARKLSPRDPRLAFLAGRLCFDKLYWTEGMKHLREAIRLDPRYRLDPELIKTVLRGFNVTPRGVADVLAAFLREDIGDAAKPYLQETAADHPNPTIRARAAAELKRYR